jgi:hypothetical protein
MAMSRFGTSKPSATIRILLHNCLSWHAPIVALDEWESLLPLAPSPRRGLGWQHISSKVETQSGDLWLTVSEHQIDCGYCFMYDALVRVRSGERKK